MKDTLENKILKYLSENENGEYIDLSFIESYENLLRDKLKELKKDKLIKEQCEPAFVDAVRIFKNPKYKITTKGNDKLNNNTNKTILTENYIEGDNNGIQSSRSDFIKPAIQNTSKITETKPPKRSFLETTSWAFGIVVAIIAIYEFILKKI